MVDVKEMQSIALVDWGDAHKIVMVQPVHHFLLVKGKMDEWQIILVSQLEKIFKAAQIITIIVVWESAALAWMDHTAHGSLLWEK